MKKYLVHMSYFTLAITFLFIMYIFYLSFYPMKIVKLNEFSIVNHRVKRGELITYTLDFEKYRNYKSEIRYYFVDGIIIRLEDSSIQRPVGETSVTRQRMVPTTIVPGRYKMRIEIDYKITAWRTISYIWESEEFDIL